MQAASSHTAAGCAPGERRPPRRQRRPPVLVPLHRQRPPSDRLRLLRPSCRRPPPRGPRRRLPRVVPLSLPGRARRPLHAARAVDSRQRVGHRRHSPRLRRSRRRRRSCHKRSGSQQPSPAHRRKRHAGGARARVFGGGRAPAGFTTGRLPCRRRSAFCASNDSTARLRIDRLPGDDRCCISLPQCCAALISPAPAGRPALPGGGAPGLRHRRTAAAHPWRLPPAPRQRRVLSAAAAPSCCCHHSSSFCCHSSSFPARARQKRSRLRARPRGPHLRARAPCERKPASPCPSPVSVQGGPAS